MPHDADDSTNSTGTSGVRHSSTDARLCSSTPVYVAVTAADSAPAAASASTAARGRRTVSSSAPSENAAAQANAATSANDPAAIADGVGEESRPSKRSGRPRSTSRHSMPVASVTVHIGHARAKNSSGMASARHRSTRAHSSTHRTARAPAPVPPRKR